MKRKFLVVMTLAAILTVVPNGSAVITATPMQMTQLESGEVQPRYLNAARIATALKIEGGTATAFSSVTAKRVCRIVTMMKLQKKEGTTWDTVRTWTAASDTGILDLTKTLNLTNRGTYRVYTEFDVAGEELSITSDSKTY